MSAIEALDRYAKTRHRHMGRGELMESDAGLGRRIVAALVERGVDDSELDELVYEAVGAGSGRMANSVSAVADQVRSISSGESRASDINNAGVAGQVEFLMRAWGAETLLGEVRGLLRPSAPTP